MRSSILFDNVPLKQLTEVKFLGVCLDEGLTWKSHIGYICKKIAKSVGIFYWCRFLLSTKTRTSLYYTLIYPYLAYCTVLWSSTYVTNLNRIFLLQKRAVRAITNSQFRAPSVLLFDELKILDIFKVNSLYIAKFMFLYHHHLLRLPFKNLFFTNNQIHNYDTGASSELHLFLGPICAGQTLSRSLYSIKDQKSGILCHFQLHPFPVYLPLKDSLLISLTIKCYSK